MHRNTVALAVVWSLFLVAPLASEGAPAADAGPTVLARAGDVTIDVEEFRAEMARRGGHVPGAYATVEQRRALLDEMIQSRALALAAIAAGYDRDPEFRAAVERMLGTRYLREHLDEQLSNVSVSEDEIAAFYESHRDEYLTPARARAAWVLIRVPRKATPEAVEKARERAEAAREEALALPGTERNLGDVARRLSEDAATRYTGGEIGWIYESQGESYRLGPEFVHEVFALSGPGSLSPVLRHELGFYFLKLVEREGAAPAPLEKMAPGIRSRLLKQKQEATRAAFFARLLGGTQIAIDESALAAIQPLAPAEKPEREPPPLPGG